MYGNNGKDNHQGTRMGNWCSTISAVKIHTCTWVKLLCKYNIDEIDVFRQVSNISRTESQNLNCFSSRLADVFAQYIKAENEDVVGAAPTGDAPTTSEWSTI